MAVSAAPTYSAVSQPMCVAEAVTRTMLLHPENFQSVRSICRDIKSGSHPHLYLPVHNGAHHWVSLIFDREHRRVTYFDPLNLSPVRTEGYPAALESVLPGFTWSDVAVRVQADSATCGLWTAFGAEVWREAREGGVHTLDTLRARCVAAKQSGSVQYITDFRTRVRTQHPALLSLTYDPTPFVPPPDDGRGTSKDPLLVSDSESEDETPALTQPTAPTPPSPAPKARFPGPRSRGTPSHTNRRSSERTTRTRAEGRPPAKEQRGTSPAPPTDATDAGEQSDPMHCSDDDDAGLTDTTAYTHMEHFRTRTQEGGHVAPIAGPRAEVDTMPGTGARPCPHPQPPAAAQQGRTRGGREGAVAASIDAGSLTLGTWNTHGLLQRTRTPAGPGERHPHTQLADVLAGTGAHVMLVQETWLRHERSGDTRYRPRGYRAYHSSLPSGLTRSGARVANRSPQHRGTRAGVAIFVSDELQPGTMVTRIDPPVALQGYLIGVAIRRIGEPPLVILNVYAPPSDFWPEVMDGLRVMAGEAQREHCTETVLIGGDLNAASFPGDRRGARFTARDRSFHEWIKRTSIHPADQYSGSTEARLASFESKSGPYHSRVDDWLYAWTPSLEECSQSCSTVVHQDLGHDSDHHPVTLTINWSHMGPLPPTTTHRRRRIVCPLTADGRVNLASALSARLGAKVDLWAGTVLRLGTTGDTQDTGRLEPVAAGLAALMQEALAVTMETVGEPEGNTVLQPPPGSRPQQHGHLSHGDKRTHSGAMGKLVSLRKVLRALRRGQPGSTNQAVEDYRVAHELADDGQVRTHAQQAARETRATRNQALRHHDARMRIASLAKFNHTIRYDARTAHRLLLAKGEHRPLRAVRMGGGRLVTDTSGILEEVRKYFAEVSASRVSPDTAKTEPWLQAHQPHPPLDPITYGASKDHYGAHPPPMAAAYTRGVYDMCLAEMPGKKAPGQDGVYNEVLKYMPPSFHDGLHAMFAHMWKLRRTPDSWKVALTVLMYKKGDPYLIKNHRPIGLLNCVYKLWTATVTALMTDFADTRRVLSDTQEGFRARRNTTRQLRRLLMAAEDAKARDHDLYVLYVDFVNAFGSVDHHRMLHILGTQGFPTDCIEIIADLYKGASVVVRTPVGDTAPVPNGGRGTVQGDTLSPLLFLLAIDPLLAWLEAGGHEYGFSTSKEKVGPLAYADDLAILAPSHEHLWQQAAKVARFNEYMGMESNFAPDKTAWTVARWSLRGKAAMQHTLRMGEHTVPNIPPSQPYVYLGVHIPLTLDFRAHVATLKERVRQRSRAIANAKCNPGLALRMLEMVVRPAVRYSMGLGVLSLADVRSLNSDFAAAAKKVCGLPATSASLACYRRRDDYGLGVDPLLLTHLHATCEQVTELLNSVEDLGEMFRGLLAHHSRSTALAGFSAIPCGASRARPVLRLLSQATRMGIGWVDSEGLMGVDTAGTQGPDERGTLVSAALEAGMVRERLHFLQPLWAVGLYDLHQVVTHDGDRLCTHAELARSIHPVRMGEAQKRALSSLAKVLHAGTGLLAGQRLPPRSGPLDDSWVGEDRHTVENLEGRQVRARLRREREGPAEEEGEPGEPGEPEEQADAPRPKRKRRGGRWSTRRKKGYTSSPINSRRVVLDTEEGRALWDFQRILGKRTVRQYERVHEPRQVGKRRRGVVSAPQAQYLVEWLGTEVDGSPTAPTWEPVESFATGDDPDAILAQTQASDPKGLTPIAVSSSRKPLAGRRVLSRLPGTQIHKTGTLLPNPRKRAYPYVLRYDDPHESDEEVDMVPEGEPPDIIVQPTGAEAARLGPGTPPSTMRDTLRAALVSEQLVIGGTAVRPGQDIEPTGTWEVISVGVEGPTELLRVYSPEGTLAGVMTRQRINRLHSEYRYHETQHPREFETLAPLGFLPELGAMFARYNTGKDRGDGGRVDMNMHWGTPTPVREALRTSCRVTHEMYASPLNFHLSLDHYFSAHPRDVLFGALGSAYGHKWGGPLGGVGRSVYMNPEYRAQEMRRALEWAIAASLDPAPFSAVGVLPRWFSSAYMNLLGHPNVERVVTFKRNTFAFIPPDALGTTGGGKAGWPVMVIEVTNAAGRAKYRTAGYRRKIAQSGVSLGAQVAEGEDLAFRPWPPQTRERHKVPSEYTEAPWRTPDSRRVLAGGEPLAVTAVTDIGSRLAHVHEGTQLYTDGSKIRGEVGAGVHDASTVGHPGLKMKVNGAQTVNRAELVAILEAVRYAPTDDDVVIYTDSMVALQKVRNWILRPSQQTDGKHSDVAHAICTLIVERRARVRTKILKVPAHVGVPGNEEADRLAKEAALEDMHPEDNPVKGPEPHAPPRFTLHVTQEGEGTLKQRLRVSVMGWLASEYRLGHVYHDIWTDQALTDALDTDASTWMWRKGGDIPRNELVHALRMRNGEFVCNYELHKRGLSDTAACPLCGEAKDGWAHTAGGHCRYSVLDPLSGIRRRPLNGLAVSRHNAACRVLQTAISEGTKSKWLCLFSFGREDGLPEQASIPEWMARTLQGFTMGALKPDFFMLEGWPSTVDPPRTDGNRSVPQTRGGTRVRVVLADLTFTMDDAPASWTRAREAKQLKYGPLLEKMSAAGWQVDRTVRVVTIGHRATLPRANGPDMEELGVRRSDVQALQRKLHVVAARHLARLVRFTRETRARNVIVQPPL